ncbi:hypothetical protein F5050DRAFT_1578589 [Lentinula boryana]|uniref:Thioesterase thiol ester dehydrase-isomerase n=1 Tax=Lentinula boryana TaxID=40481 RepID=A0ABQ8Q2Z3_9AGAR|nr:hypothetical protein F5050DRAFT_1578589 [Lentinula boryana]
MASALKPLTRSPKSIAKLINLSSRSSRLPIRIIHSLNVLPLIQIFLRIPFASFLSFLSSLIPSFISFLPHLFVSLLILNSRSLPFTWTFRVLWCVIKVRTRYSAAWARVWARYWMRCSKKLMEFWLESVTPVGAHPFEWEGSYATWVGFDDSDFNMHMSNSSYPKVLDFARTKASLELFPQFLRVGGHVALSSTHFQFIQEIPLFSRYQILTSIGAWDEKWCYLIFRFVTIENKYKNNQHSGSANVPRILITPPDLNKHHSPDPVHFSFSSNLHHSQSGVNLNSHPTVPDSKLHTIAVSRICFKVGRITVPPAIVFTTNGLSLSSSSPSPFAVAKFSHANPPPSWTEHGLYLIAKTHNGDEAKLREFYRGAWRNTKEATDGKDTNKLEWWDLAMGIGTPADDTRKARLEVCRMLVGGMEGVKEMC